MSNENQTNTPRPASHEYERANSCAELGMKGDQPNMQFELLVHSTPINHPIGIEVLETIDNLVRRVQVTLAPGPGKPMKMEFTCSKPYHYSFNCNHSQDPPAGDNTPLVPYPDSDELIIEYAGSIPLTGCQETQGAGSRKKSIRFNSATCAGGTMPSKKTGE